MKNFAVDLFYAHMDFIGNWMMAVVGMVAAPGGEERRQGVMKRWQALTGLVGAAAAIFGAGMAFAVWGAGIFDAPDKLQILDMRMQQVEQQIHTLVCELRDERGLPSTDACLRGLLR